MMRCRLQGGGTAAVRADVILDLESFLVQVSKYTEIKLETLHHSRLHRAVQLISSNTAIWPCKITELSQRILAVWMALFGSLDDIRPNVFGYDGRLWGVSKAHETNHEVSGYHINTGDQRAPQVADS